MKLLHRKNIIPTIAITYTLVSLSLTIYEIIDVGYMNPTQLNIFLFFILSVLGVGIVYLHYYLDFLSPLVTIILQYALAISIIVGGLWIASHFVPIHPDGYQDMIRSFTIPYSVGILVYYVSLRHNIKKQNQILATIQANNKQ